MADNPAAPAGLFAKLQPKRMILTAVITRADGRIEDLGTIAYWHRNPVIRWLGTQHLRLARKAHP